MMQPHQQYQPALIAEPLRLGDPVRHRSQGSHGPVMTVQGFGPRAGQVSCRWFDGATLRGDTFDVGDLVLYVHGQARQGYRTK